MRQKDIVLSGELDFCMLTPARRSNSNFCDITGRAIRAITRERMSFFIFSGFGQHKSTKEKGKIKGSRKINILNARFRGERNYALRLNKVK